MSKDVGLMLDIFNSCIVTGVNPKVGSECHKRLIRIMDKHGFKITAKTMAECQPKSKIQSVGRGDK